MKGKTIASFRASFSATEIKGALANIRANQARLDGCALHRFAPAEVALGSKQSCLACGGEIGNVELGYYIAGYEAGGGAADDVWPGWRKEPRP